MTTHHLIREEEMLQNCIYCGKSFDMSKWESNFHIRKHYKEMKCECGKIHKITMSFQGSGHDTWLDKIVKEIKLNTIEDKVILK